MGCTSASKTLQPLITTQQLNPTVGHCQMTTQKACSNVCSGPSAREQGGTLPSVTPTVSVLAAQAGITLT